MARVGVVGVGNIGGAVAVNLVADGHDVVVAAASEITVTSLPTPEAVAGVATAWAEAAAPGSILLDLSTSSPEGNRALAATLAASGHHFVEAPLTGGVIGAQKRALVFMVGGDDEAGGPR